MNTTGQLSYSDKEGQKALVASEITFYFNRMDNAGGLAEAYNVIMRHIGKNLRWYRTETMTRSSKMNPEVYDFLSVWFKAGTKLRREYELTLTSNENQDLGESWGLRFGVESDLLPDGAGYFQVSFPQNFASEQSQEFLSLALKLGDYIKFRSGHAGYGVQYDEGDLDDERDAQIGAWCRRYLCVDYRDFAATAEYMGNSIKGVGWLTFIDQDFVGLLGGTGKIKRKLGANAVVHAYKHGLAIQAGPAPILGDKNKREDVGVYKEVFRAVEPVVVKEDLALPGFDEDESLDWINRFA